MFRIEITAETSRELLHKVESLYLEMTRDSSAKVITNAVTELPRRKFKVLLSPYPDINPGDVGEMMDELSPTTVALRFEKLFTKADNLEHRELAKRIIAFDRKQVEEIKQ